MGKKVKKDDKPAADDVFDPLLVESKQAGTVVLMLDSPEEEVLAKACEAIYTFVDKCDDNRKQLLDLGALDKLVKLMQTPDDKIIRRNAVMCLGVMTANPEVRRDLRKKEETIPALLALLSPEEDTVVHEFAALGLSHMCQEFSSKITVFEHNGVEALIRCLSSGDPDVQKNGIETLALMMQDYHSRSAVRDNEGFPPILELLKSEFAIIQELALVALTRAALDAENRSILRELEALNVLINFVGKPEYNDLHVHALHALSNCLEEHESMKQIKDNGGLSRLMAFIIDQTPPEEETSSKDSKKGKKSGKGKKSQSEDDDKKGGEPSHTLPEVKRHACRAIARAAHIEDNRKLLHEQEAEKMMIALLAHEDHTVQVAAAQALGVMAERVSSREAISSWDGIDPLIKLLKPDDGDVREAVTLALANLTLASTNNCNEIMSKNGMEPLIHLLADQREYTVANCATALTNMATIEHLRSELQHLGVIQALITPLKSDSPLVQSKAATATAAFTIEADARNELRESGGLEPLVELLKSNDEHVRRAASWAITIVAVDEITVAELSRLGVLDILQDIQLSCTRQNRFTEAAMSKMLDNNLPAKYALTGRLDSTDLIADGFYDVGQLRPGVQFRSLEDYCKDPLNQKRPVLLINAKIPKPSSAQTIDNAESRTSVQTKSRKKSSRRQQQQQQQQQPQQQQQEQEDQGDTEEKEEDEQIEEFQIPSDANFNRYLLEVQEKVSPIADLKQQVISLAEYVSEKLGGSIDRGQVSNFSYELPISQLKYNLESNVVPIGLITSGIHYHRALLFKALSDRCGIPCSLVRGQYNRAWNEIMLVDDHEQQNNPDDPGFPPKRYIVDLIHHPGYLMRTDSVEASNYQKI